jgi:hypothetical protein
MMTKGLIGRLLVEEEISAKTSPEPLRQMRDPTLDERVACTCVQLMERAILGTRSIPTRETSSWMQWRLTLPRR